MFGSNMPASKGTQTMLSVAASFNPDLAVISGPIAYDNG